MTGGIGEYLAATKALRYVKMIKGPYKALIYLAARGCATPNEIAKATGYNNYNRISRLVEQGWARVKPETGEICITLDGLVKLLDEATDVLAILGAIRDEMTKQVYNRVETDPYF